MFRQGKHPALVIGPERLLALQNALRRAGYAPHRGARFERKGEIAAWTRDLPDGRHVHLQEVAWTKGRIALFAHTEPATSNLLAHAWSALTDGANFSAGARTLRADLRRVSFVR